MPRGKKLTDQWLQTHRAAFTAMLDEHQARLLTTLMQDKPSPLVEGNGSKHHFALAPVTQRGMAQASHREKSKHQSKWKRSAGGATHSNDHPLPKGKDGKYRAQ